MHPTCLVDLSVSIYVMGKQLQGTATLQLPFPPVAGQHVGPSQLLTICQVHLLGPENSAFRYRADIETVYDPTQRPRYPGVPPEEPLFENAEAVVAMIRDQTGSWIEWTFAEVEESKEDEEDA